MNFGTNANRSYRGRRRRPKVGAIVPTIARDSMGGCTSCGPGVRGALYHAQSTGPGKRAMLGLRKGSGPGAVSRAGRGVSLGMRASTGARGKGRQRMGLWCARPRGEKEAGPHPTARAKPGDKEQLLSDGRGVPLSRGSTAANVTEGPMLWVVLTSWPLVRAQPGRTQPHPLCLDAAFANASARAVLLIERYSGHLAPKGGRPGDAGVHPGGQARRGKVERPQAWHDRFRRLVVNGEHTLTSRYAFLCLAKALIAYRM